MYLCEKVKNTILIFAMGNFLRNLFLKLYIMSVKIAKTEDTKSRLLSVQK